MQVSLVYKMLSELEWRKGSTDNSPVIESVLPIRDFRMNTVDKTDLNANIKKIYLLRVDC